MPFIRDPATLFEGRFADTHINDKTQGATATFAPPFDIPYNTLEFRTTPNNSSGGVITISHAGTNLVFTQDETQTIQGPGVINASNPIVWENTNNAANSQDLWILAFKVDGKYLASNNNIGVDASGQDNHFHDQNFAVGNTDEVWSDFLTSKNGWFSSNRNNKAAFNGSSSAATPDKQGEITFSCNLQNVSTIGFIIDVVTGITVTGDLGSKAYTSGTVTGWTLFSIPSSDITTIIGNNITKVVLKASNSSDSTYLKSVVVNGQVLIDANIQDTVLDTPMNNYAVLEAGKNGNLVGTGAGSLVGTVKGDNWYCEVTPTAGTTNSDGNDVMHIQIFDENNSEVLVWRSNTGDTYTVGDVIGITIKDNKYQWYKNGSIVSKAGSSTDGPGSGTVSGTTFTPVFLNGGNNNAEAAFNFGQQPFVYADYNDDHTSTLKNTSPLYKENWSDDVAQADNPENAFDGDLTTSSYNRQNQGKSTITFDPTS